MDRTQVHIFYLFSLALTLSWHPLLAANRKCGPRTQATVSKISSTEIQKKRNLLQTRLALIESHLQAIDPTLETEAKAHVLQNISKLIQTHAGLVGSPKEHLDFAHNLYVIAYQAGRAHLLDWRRFHLRELEKLPENSSQL
jgi:hypothetical protein